MAVGYLTGPLRRFARLHVDSDIILANVCALHVLLSLRLVAAENYVLMIYMTGHPRVWAVQQPNSRSIRKIYGGQSTTLSQFSVVLLVGDM